MQYILITLSAIAIATFVIYLLGNKVFGVRLRMKSLIMCALCAALMSIVLPRIVVSFTGIAGTIGFLAVFAIIFAYFVAYYDDPDDLDSASPVSALEHRLQTEQPVTILPVTEVIATAEKEHAAASHNQQMDELTAQTQGTLIPLELTSESEVVEVEVSEQKAPEAKVPQAEVSEPEAFEPEESKAVNEALVGLVFGSSSITDTATDTESIVEVSPDYKNELAATVSAWDEPKINLPTIAAMSELSLEMPIDPEPDNEPTLETLELAIDVSLIPQDEYPVNTDLNSELSPAAEALPEGQEDSMFDLHTDKPAPISDTLDDLLDFAFRQKDCKNFPLALDTFQRALKLHRESDAAPLLAVEIASLLKNRGAYDEAITFLTANRGLSALQQDTAMDQEIISSIAYLRIVKNTLLHHRCGFMPFTKIPQDVLQEIDAEFREWRNLA